MSEALPARNVDIGQVLEAARFGTLSWLAEEKTPYDSLAGPAEALLNLLEERKVEFVLVGGLAVLQWVDGRNTQDIDLVMSPKELARLPELRVVYRDRDFVRSEFHGILVDILFTRNKLFALVNKKYTVLRDFGRHRIRCATPEGLVLMKLFALPSLYRQGRFEKVRTYEADVANLMRIYQPGMDSIIDALAPHILAGDLAEIRKIVADLDEIISRFEQKPFGEARGEPSPP